MLKVRLEIEETEGKRGMGQYRMRRLDTITDSVDMNLKTLLEIVENRGAWCAAVHEAAKSQAQLRDETATIETQCREKKCGHGQGSGGELRG